MEPRPYLSLCVSRNATLDSTLSETIRGVLVYLLPHDRRAHFFWTPGSSVRNMGGAKRESVSVHFLDEESSSVAVGGCVVILLRL